MTRILKGLFIFALYLLLINPVVYANDQVKENQTNKDSWISNGKYLGTWWLQNAKLITPLPEPLLYHIEASYSYTGLKGNVDGDIQSGDLSFFLRKNIFTSSTYYKLSHNTQTVTLSNQTTVTETDLFHQGFSLDITDWMSLQTGVMWARDTNIYVDKRNTYYGGVSFPIFPYPKFIFCAGLYYGYEETAYMNSEVQKNIPSGAPPFNIIPEYSSGALRLMQNLTWIPDKHCIISQSLDYMHTLKDTDVYHWKADLSVSLPINDNLSIVLSYAYNYDVNPLSIEYENYFKRITASGGQGAEIHYDDSNVSAGIKINF